MTMEVSTEIKENLRKAQTDLKNAIRIHQIWVSRLEEDENNAHLKLKVKEAEKEIVSIGQTQKRVIDLLRRELELYHQRLKAKNKQVNLAHDNHFIAQQLRDHQLQYQSQNRTISLIKPSVLNEIHPENKNGLKSEDVSDSEFEKSNEKENSRADDVRDRHQRNAPSAIQDSRNNLANALIKVQESLMNNKAKSEVNWTDQIPYDSESSHENMELTPSPSPPPYPEPQDQISQEIFLRFVGLVTPEYKAFLIKKRFERKKRARTSTNKKDYLYESSETNNKRKKYNQFPYLQANTGPPTTRSAKLKKRNEPKPVEKSSREPSPSGSSTDKDCSSSKPAWAASLPAGLSVEPVYRKSVCHGCGRNDVPSLIVRCTSCAVSLHTGCGTDGRCSNCDAALPDPSNFNNSNHRNYTMYKDKLAERKRLQEKNIQLCIELRKLEARAATLKENLDDGQADKRQLLAEQINTQRNLQKLLDFISQFKETSLSIRTSSESGSELSRSNEE